MYIFERCQKSMVSVKSCNNSDDDRVRIIPSLLRWSVEECNFGRFSYFIIFVLHFEEIHIVFYHLQNPKILNVTPLVKSSQKNSEITLNKDYLMFPLRIRL